MLSSEILLLIYQNKKNLRKQFRSTKKSPLMYDDILGFIAKFKLYLCMDKFIKLFTNKFFLCGTFYCFHATFPEPTLIYKKISKASIVIKTSVWNESFLFTMT